VKGPIKGGEIMQNGHLHLHKEEYSCCFTASIIPRITSGMNFIGRRRRRRRRRREAYTI
jgi:hypothetical protein